MEANHELYGIIEKPNIREVKFGEYSCQPWYGSGVYFGRNTHSLGIRAPSKSADNGEYWLDTLFVCDTCFKYTDIEQEMEGHLCGYVKPPGRIKYREQYTIRRVKGSKHKLFCQSLCLFTKLFLDNKSMYFKVDNYEFYIVYDGNKPMGFFSREIVSWDQNNLACILVFPPFQRKGLGNLLMEFSYALSKPLISGPEKPLSPFGLVGYLKFWSGVIARDIEKLEIDSRQVTTLQEISEITGFRTDDVLMTLKHMGAITKDGIISLGNIRQWKPAPAREMRVL